MERYLRVVSMLLLSLFITGCVGVVNKDVYDGSLSALDITIKRDVVNALSITTFEEKEVTEVLVRITKTNDDGDLIYDAVKTVPLVNDTQEYTVTEMVPSDKEYKLTAINAVYGNLELGTATADVPAEKVTSVDIILEGLGHLLVSPVKVYSGGSLSQFKLSTSEFDGDFQFSVYLATMPWIKNGKNSGEYLEIPEEGVSWTSTGAPHHRLPEVTEPTKLYYQFRLLYNYYIPRKGYVAAYYPNIDAGEELPYIWLYPSPDWEPEE